MKKYVYVAFLDGVPLFASDDREEIFERINQHEYNSIVDTADEYDWNVEDESDYERAVVQNSIDSGSYTIEYINISKLKKDEEYELSDGTLIDSSEILSLL